MAKTRTFTCTVDGKTLTRKSQTKDYKFVVVGTPDIESARAYASRTEPTKDDREDYRWYEFKAAQKAGVPAYWARSDWNHTFTQEDIDAAREKIEGGLDGYMARDQQRRHRDFIRNIDEGYFTHTALVWTSRHDLAQKYAQEQRAKGYRDVRVLPVDQD